MRERQRREGRARLRRGSAVHAPLRAHDIEVALHPEVYEPAEDSFLLADALLARDLAGTRALDVGTGTGIAAVAMAERGARVVAVDANPHAVHLARRNLAGRGGVVRGDLATAFRGPFDLVAFNAPYLPSARGERVEGWLDAAFHGGDDGVAVARRFVRDLPRLLAPGGEALLVASTRGDLGALATEAADAGLAVDEVGDARFFFERVVLLRLRRSGRA